MCTPFDLQSVAELKSINLEAYKIASADITNIPLIKEIAKTKTNLYEHRMRNNGTSYSCT